MQTRRRLLTIVAALLVAPTLPSPAGAAERSLTVSLPATITENQNFAYTWEGHTGGTVTFYGTDVKISFFKGAEECADPRVPTDYSKMAADSERQLVSHAGAFRGGGQTYVSDYSGPVRVCGFLEYTTDDGASRFGRATQLAFTTVVDVLPHTGDFLNDRIAGQRGTYYAGPTDIAGGGPNASITFVVRKSTTQTFGDDPSEGPMYYDQVVAVSATGLPAATCIDGERHRPIRTRFASSRAGRKDNLSFGYRFDSSWSRASGKAEIVGNAISATGISGTLVVSAKTAGCRTGFGFSATRISSSQKPLR